MVKINCYLGLGCKHIKTRRERHGSSSLIWKKIRLSRQPGKALPKRVVEPFDRVGLPLLFQKRGGLVCIKDGLVRSIGIAPGTTRFIGRRNPFSQVPSLLFLSGSEDIRNDLTCPSAEREPNPTVSFSPLAKIYLVWFLGEDEFVCLQILRNRLGVKP